MTIGDMFDETAARHADNEALMARVILWENENVTEDQFRDFCREKIADKNDR